ncbi:FkbM family methyltransferase [Marinobacter sp.]|uniref:FkbM family methyltransferase n=1 Tax=Marinobacter sp. TaxID=50741 RepID=UPI003A93C6E8
MNFTADLVALSVELDDDNLNKLAGLIEQYRDWMDRISTGLYSRLGTEAERKRFVAWFVKRWANINTVSQDEWQRYAEIVQRSHAEHGREFLDGQEYVIRRYDEAGYDFELLGYDWFSGVHDIQFDQYATDRFDVRPGDVIIDGGAFIGDTAVLFAAKTAGDCQIHTFELLEENLALLQHNIERNGIADRVTVNRVALGDERGKELSIAVTRLQASMSLMFPGALKVPLIRLDDYVQDMGLERVDFIKFDIEGAEIPALEGARQTIETHHPRMALCLYHKWDDVLTILAFLDSLTVRYDNEFKWVQLKLGTEGVILLTPKTQCEVPDTQSAEAAACRALDAAMFRLFDGYQKKYKQADDLWQARKGQVAKPTH